MENYSTSCRMFGTFAPEDMPPIENPTDRTIHFCKYAILKKLDRTLYHRNRTPTGHDCIGRKDGSFWIVDEEYYDWQVKYCPHCGIKAPNQNISTRD